MHLLFLERLIIGGGNNSEKGKDNLYTIETTTRDTQILRLVIKRKINNKIHILKIQDSLVLLNFKRFS